MILAVLMLAAIQVFVLFCWNEEDAPLYWLKLWFAPRCPLWLYKPLIECLTCQSWWMSVFSVGVMMGYYCNFVMILLIPLLWISTLLMYRYTFE